MPRGSIDTHVHIFEPGYKLSPVRGYNPPYSTLADLKLLHSTLGIDRVVFTQPSVYGVDNSAILNGMAAFNAETANRARAVVAITMDISDDELVALDRSGVRGVRLNTDNKGGMPIEMSAIHDSRRPDRFVRLAHRVPLSRQRHHRADANLRRGEGADIDRPLRLPAGNGGGAGYRDSRH